MFSYAMKAKASSRTQLADRIRKFEKLKIEPIVELFLSGIEDAARNREMVVENCAQFRSCKYLVHFPVSDIESKYIYDAHKEDGTYIKLLLNFCEEINSAVLIMHRCYGFGIKIDKEKAEEKFFEKMVLWNKLAAERNVKILIENYGFVWLPEHLGVDYVSSPLDHFFPWDIARFNEDSKRLNLKNIGVILDIAHAVLSSNMFNMLKRHPELGSDGRFSNIYASDLEKRDLLKPDDFIFDFIDYFHISDSFIWQQEDGLSDIKKYLYTENLPLGRGNINYREMFKNVTGSKTMVMEINSEDGNYDDNVSQLKAVQWFKESFN